MENENGKKTTPTISFSQTWKTFSAHTFHLSPSDQRRRGGGGGELQAHRRRETRAHARPLFDEMPPGSEATGSERVAAAGALDRLSAQKDEVLHRVLSFLPSKQAVKTCLLARRWRYVWKSARGLRVNGAVDYKYQSANHMNLFVNSLLLLRKPSPVDMAEINSHVGNGSDEDEESPEGHRYLELWIRYCLSWEARVLCVRNNTRADDRWLVPRRLITSNHLMVLELDNVRLDVSCLDFSCCPVLENLRMKDCDLDEAMEIMSPSVKHLSMKSCHFNYGTRPEISFPNLIFMELADSWGCFPLLQNMPLLVSAFVRIFCNPDCRNIEDSTCVLLGSLSNSTNLELTCNQYEPILRKDLAWCPVFSKLKTLLLNEWCVTDLGALYCFLQHSPILEKLTLQLPETLEGLVETEPSYDMVKEPLALEHLTVAVKCHDVDDGKIHRILKLLEFCGVPSEQIRIEPPPELKKSGYHDHDLWSSGSFSYEQVETGLAVDEPASSDSSVDEDASSDSSVDEATSSDSSDFTNSS